MEEVLVKTKKKSKSREFKEQHIDFQICHHCDNPNLTFVKDFEVKSSTKVEIKDVYLCEKCGCHSYLHNGERAVTYYPNITDMKKHMSNLGKPEHFGGATWVSDRDKQLMKN